MPLPTTGIDPTAILAIRDLELRARVIVEGLWSGLHRSPQQGFSVEFTEYRQYSPGDDLRYLDWKTLGRSDRLYIKKFEDETNLRCHIICRKRGMLIVVSDFLSPPSEWERQIGQLAAAGHDVRAIQLLDPAEIDLNFGKAALWSDMESDKQLYIDPREAKRHYSDRFNEHQEKVKSTLESFAIRHQITTTDQPFDFALLELMRQSPIIKRGGRK